MHKQMAALIINKCLHEDGLASQHNSNRNCLAKNFPKSRFNSGNSGKFAPQEKPAIWYMTKSFIYSPGVIFCYSTFTVIIVFTKRECL